MKTFGLTPSPARAITVAIGSALLLSAPPARADSPVFDRFFQEICDQVSSRGGDVDEPLDLPCSLTDGVGISGESQDSLVPTQFTALNLTPFLRSEGRSRFVRKQLLERNQKDGAPSEQPDQPFTLRQARQHFLGRAAPGSINAQLSSASELEDRLSFITNAQRGTFDQALTGREREADGDRATLDFGADYRLDESTTLGALFVSDRTSYRFSNTSSGEGFPVLPDAGKVATRTQSLSVFAGRALGDSFHLNGSISYGRTRFDVRRKAVFQASFGGPVLPFGTRASPRGSELSVAAGVDYFAVVGAFNLDLYARGDYTRANVQAYTERPNGIIGGPPGLVFPTGLEFRVNTDPRTTLTSVLGARTQQVLSLPFGVAIPEIAVEYHHVFGDTRQDVAVRFASDPVGNSFKFDSDPITRNSVQVTLATTFVLPRGFNFFVQYQAIFGSEELSRDGLTTGFRSEF